MAGYLYTFAVKGSRELWDALRGLNDNPVYKYHSIAQRRLARRFRLAGWLLALLAAVTATALFILSPVLFAGHWLWVLMQVLAFAALPATVLWVVHRVYLAIVGTLDFTGQDTGTAGIEGMAATGLTNAEIATGLIRAYLTPVVLPAVVLGVLVSTIAWALNMGGYTAGHPMNVQLHFTEAGSDSGALLLKLLLAAGLIALSVLTGALCLVLTVWVLAMGRVSRLLRTVISSAVALTQVLWIPVSFVLANSGMVLATGGLDENRFLSMDTIAVVLVVAAIALLGASIHGRLILLFAGCLAIAFIASFPIYSFALSGNPYVLPYLGSFRNVLWLSSAFAVFNPMAVDSLWLFDADWYHEGRELPYYFQGFRPWLLMLIRLGLIWLTALLAIDGTGRLRKGREAGVFAESD